MRALIASLFVVISLGGCKQPNPAYQPVEPVTTDGAELVVTTNNSFDLVLPSPGVSPYQWQALPHDTSLLRFDGERAGAHAYDGDSLPGYAPHRVFTYTGLKIGSTELVFELKAISGAESEPQSVRRFKIVIGAAATQP